MAMAEAPAPDGSTALPGLTLNYVGEGRYQALSGSVNVDNNEITLLEFYSPDDAILEVYVEFFYLAASSADYMYKIYLNDIIILALSSQSSGINRQPDAIILLPSNTLLKATAENVEDSNTIGQAAVMTGRDVTV